VGKYQHARLQALLAARLGEHESKWSAIVVVGQRVRVSANRVRIPDVALIPPGNHSDVITDPPILVVEILSPDDTYSDTEERASDYLAMGVEAVWIVDPKTRTAHMCIGQAWVAAPRLHVPGTPIHLELADIYSRLDRSGQSA
jgi:Uma2 family endonuclease